MTNLPSKDKPGCKKKKKEVRVQKCCTQPPTYDGHLCGDPHRVERKVPARRNALPRTRTTPVKTKQQHRRRHAAASVRGRLFTSRGGTCVYLGRRRRGRPKAIPLSESYVTASLVCRSLLSTSPARLPARLACLSVCLSVHPPLQCIGALAEDPPGATDRV